MELGKPEGTGKPAGVTAGGAAVKAEIAEQEGRFVITFAQPLVLEAGQKMVVGWREGYEGAPTGAGGSGQHGLTRTYTDLARTKVDRD